MGTAEFYEIRVEGHLESGWSDCLEGLAIRHDDSGETILSGPIVDQAALRGVLCEIHDLNLTLVSVNRIRHSMRPGTSPGRRAGDDA